MMSDTFSCRTCWRVCCRDGYTFEIVFRHKSNDITIEPFCKVFESVCCPTCDGAGFLCGDGIDALCPVCAVAGQKTVVINYWHGPDNL